MRAVRLIGRVLGWIVLTTVLLAASTLLTAVIVGRSEWGRRKILSIALPALQERLVGHLAIGRLEGNLTRELVLYDVELDDVERQPAVRVKALAVRYDLLSLLRRTIDLTELRAEGAWVHARVLADGTLNLAREVKPSPPQTQTGSGFRIRLAQVSADLEARYDGPATGERPAQTVRGTVHLRGRAFIDGARVEAAVEELRVLTTSPLRAELSGAGAATFDHGALSADGLKLALAAEGTELRKLAPEVALRGHWQVALQAHGPADRLAVSLVARPPAGTVAIDALVHTVAGPIRWRASVRGRDLDPAAAIAGAPRGELRLAASGRGKGSAGTVDLEELVASIAGAHVQARGTIDSAGDAKITADVSARDLTRLGAIGVRRLAGGVDAHARVERTRSHLHVDLDARAQGLVVATQRVGRLDAHIHAHDLIGEAHVAASGVQAAGLRLDTLKLDAVTSPRAVQATVVARGPDRTALDLVAHGTPTVVRHRGGIGGVKVSGADLTVDKLVLARHGDSWTTRGPATVRVHDGVEVHKLEMTSGAQHLGLDAKYDARSGAIFAELRGQQLNLRELLHLAKPSLDLPDTALAIEARVRGTAAAPVVEATLDGHSERSERLGLNRIHYRVSASYADERARAQWTLSALGESFHGKADVPTVASGNRPLSVEMVASNIKMAQLRKVLPPALARVDGRLDGSVRASGTTQRPLVSVFVHGRGWQLDGDAKNNDVQLKVDYGNQRLNARADVHLQQVLGKDAGALTAQLELPIDLSLAKVQKTRRFMAQLEHRTPIAAVVTLAHVDLGRFPFAPLGVKAPLDAGVVDGSVKLRGTLHQPLLDVDLEGRDLRKGQVNKVDVYASVDYADKRARGRVDASLRGAPLLRVRGEAPIDFQRVIDGQPYLATPLRVDAEVAGFNLARVQDLVPGIAGQLHARAEVRGTLGRPTGKLDAGVAGLSLGQTRYETLEAHGDFDGATLSAKLAAREVAGGTLSADARWPADPQAPVVAQLRAKGFRIDVALATLTNPRVVKGTLDASLDLRGPRSGPTIEGFLRLHDGELALAADPRLYQGVTIDVAVHDGALTVHEAAARVGDGSISARGSARLAGLQPQSVDLRAEAKKLPIPTGTFGAWVDAIVSLHGRRTAQGMSGTLTLEQGTANLPKLAGGRKLQKTGPLADVKFVDAQARREEEKRKEAERETAEIALVAHIPGPFHVRSKEMWTDLKGELQVAIAGPVARISGHAEAVGGWFELLGRRYSIERARVGFGGEAEPNPELDVRLTRELSETRLVIEVHGTAKKPELVLASEPPIYDQSQVIAAILSGDPASRRVDARSLESKVTGAISGILVGKIKDQIAPNLPIDVIRVGAAEGATGMADSRIEVGKYITDNIYVSYVHQFGSTYLGTQRFNANEANLEWRFKKRYEVEAAFGDAAVGRLNFFWTIRY